jgi:hypothetical protein
VRVRGGVVTGPGQGAYPLAAVHTKSFSCSVNTDPSAARARRVTWSGLGPRMNLKLQVLSSSRTPWMRASGYVGDGTLGPGAGENPPLGSGIAEPEMATEGAGAAVGAGAEHPWSVHSWTSWTWLLLPSTCTSRTLTYPMAGQAVLHPAAGNVTAASAATPRIPQPVLMGRVYGWTASDAFPSRDVALRAAKFVGPCGSPG